MPPKKELRPLLNKHHHPQRQTESQPDYQSEIKELKMMMSEMLEKLNTLAVVGSTVPEYKPANLADMIPAATAVTTEVTQYIPDVDISPKSKTRSSVKKTRGTISLGALDKMETVGE